VVDFVVVALRRDVDLLFKLSGTRMVLGVACDLFLVFAAGE
jgi:hypothetical protein